MIKFKDSPEIILNIIDNHSSIILFIDHQTSEIISSNKAAEKFYGYSSEELKTMKLSDINILSSEEIFEILNSEKFKQTNHFEFKHRKKSGEIVDVSVNINLTDIDNRQIIVAIINDITENKKIEKQLIENEERLKLAIEGSYLGFWDWNLKTNEVIYSDIWKEMLGYSKDEIKNNICEWERLVHPDDIPITTSEVNNHINGKTEYYSSEHRVLCKNGEYKWILDRGKIISRDSDGSPIRMIGTHSDIDLLKKTESNLKESEFLFKTLADFAYDWEYFESEDYSIKYISPTCYDITGYTQQEFLEDSQLTRKIINEDDFFEHRSHFQKTHNHEISDNEKEIVFRINTKNNEEKYILHACKSVFDENGKYRGKRVSNKDITELKNAEIQLKKEKENFQHFFNNLDYYAFVLDMNGNILHINNAVSEKLLYSPEDLIGKSVLEVHPIDRREEALRIVTGMLKGECDSCPIPLITKTNVQIPVETRISFGEWNKEKVIFGYSKDITALKLSEEKFSILFKLYPSPSGLSDMTNGQYIEVNEAFYNFFEYNKNEVIGNTAFELGIMDAHTREVILANADLEGNVYNVHVDLKTKSGKIKNTIVSAENIFIQDKKMRFTVVTDVTELKKAEKELSKLVEELNIANYDLERSLFEKNTLINELELTHIRLQDTINAKDKFFSIIAHDLKSPFNGLIGISELLERELMSLSMNELKQMSNALHQASLSAYNLVDELLDWSRLQVGKMPYNPHYQNLYVMIGIELNLISNKAKHKGISLKLNTIEELFAYFDKSMICTVIRNLLSNAIKFTPNGGEIIISTRHEVDFVIVSVKDNGVGISEKDIQRLFNIEFSVMGIGTEGEKGTGLGLILSKEFIEKNGGKMWVDSELGAGSTFYFSLPANKF